MSNAPTPTSHRPCRVSTGRHTTGRPRPVEQGCQPLQACGISCGLIDRIEHALVIFENSAQGTQRVEVEACGALVASGRGCNVMIGVKPALLGKAACELCIGQRIKQPDHGDWNGRKLNEMGNRDAHVSRLTVEANDETRGDEYAA